MIENNVARGVQLYPGPSDVLIANNTIVGNGKAGIQFSDDTSNSLAVNNIVAHNGEYGIRSHNLSGAGNEARRNLLWDNGSDNGSASGGTVPVDGLTVAETIAEAPRFADANYRLEPTSPAVDAAIAVAELGVDHDGRPRPRGEAPELGAYESR